MFFDKNFSKSSEFYYLEPCPYFSFTDIVEAMNTLVDGKQSRRKLYYT